MAEEDLMRFLAKIENLNELVNSFKDFPNRRDQLASCRTHKEVVDMARSWGYEIGRQWGDK